MIKSLTKIKKNDVEFALIQFNGKSNQLIHEIDKLKFLYKYDFTGQYIINNSSEYLNTLNTLTNLVTTFNKVANDYYEKNGKKEKLDSISNNLLNHIDSIIFKNIFYDEIKFKILQDIAIISFLLTLLTTFWYRKRLINIREDILHLYSMDKNNHTVFTEEVDAIKMRMGRKMSVADTNKDMIDPITQIYNNKGIAQAYNEKKNLKDSNFMTVTIFEIDNFSQSNRPFSQEAIQAILKKVAFTISLHEQSTDVVGRSGYNQFTVILSRPTKEQLFKDIDTIRQTISEVKFKIPNKGVISISVCGGYFIKNNDKSLEESIREAKRILLHAQSKGSNSISKANDLL